MCNLGALNLARFVNSLGEMNMCELMRVTDLMVRMLDAVIDGTKFSSAFVNLTSRNNRRIGLGFMGLGDALAAMRVGYNTEEGRRMAQAICDAMQAQAHTTSAELAELKGCFPNYHLSVYSEGTPTVSRRVPEGMPSSLKRRNATLTNVAPCGTISLMFGVSNGIEPQFSTAFFYKGVLDQKTAIQCGWRELFAALSREYMPWLQVKKLDHPNLWQLMHQAWKDAGRPFGEARMEEVRAIVAQAYPDIDMKQTVLGFDLALAREAVKIGDLLSEHGDEEGAMKSAIEAIQEPFSEETVVKLRKAHINALYDLTEKVYHEAFTPLSEDAPQHARDMHEAALDSVDLRHLLAECWKALDKAIAEVPADDLYELSGNIPESVRNILLDFERAMETALCEAFSNKFAGLIKRISMAGSIQGMKDIPEAIRDVFVVAGDISPADHILMQATVQGGVCSAVSKTVNMPNRATHKDVCTTYQMAYEYGLKGCTVYRDGSRVFQPLNQGIEEEMFPGEEENDFDFDLDGSVACASSSSTPSTVDSGCSDDEDEIELRSSSAESVLLRAGFTKCPECGEISLRHEGGCDTCTNCTHSACSTPLRRSTAGIATK